MRNFLKKPKDVVVLEDELRVLSDKNKTLQVENANLSEELTSLKDSYRLAERTRICSIMLDPVRLTAELRSIQPSIRAEWSGTRLVIYAESQLSSAQMNAVLGKLNKLVDLT